MRTISYTAFISLFVLPLRSNLDRYLSVDKMLKLTRANDCIQFRKLQLSLLENFFIKIT